MTESRRTKPRDDHGHTLRSVGEIETPARDTHEFESRFLLAPISPYPAQRDPCASRSLTSLAQDLSWVLILSQGDQNRVVLPSQSRLIFQAVRAKKLPVAYLLSNGGHHGFRKAENIKRALGAELHFYAKVFGFVPTARIGSGSIENL